MKKTLWFFVLIIIRLHGQISNENWYNTEDGLPQNSVKDIVKDKYGFLWISTEHGITRFDGNKFVTSSTSYNSKRFDDFQGNILKDSIFNITDQGGANILISKRSLLLSKSNRYRSTIIYKSKEYFNFSKTSLNRQIFASSHFYIYLNGIIYFFEENLITIYHIKTRFEKKINLKFTMENMERLFIHNNSIFYSDKALKKVIKIENGSASIQKSDLLYTDSESIIFWSQIMDQVFIVHKDNIYISSYKNKKLSLTKLIYHRGINNEIHSSSINSMLYDHDNNKIFLGSLTNGLCMITISPFFFSKKKASFSNNTFYATLPYNKESVIDPGGSIYNKYCEIRRGFFKENINTFSLAYDKDENLICINNNLLYKRYRKNNYQKYKVIPMPGKPDLITSEGQEIFLSLYKNNRYYLSSILHDFTEILSLFSFSSPITDIKKNGSNILVGCMNGLYLCNIKNKKIIRLSYVYVKKIVITANNTVWILTKNDGFYSYRNGILIKMPVDKNKFLTDSHTIIEDVKGNFWIPTNNGLFKADGKKLSAYAAGKLSPIFYYRYTKKDGLLTNEFNGGGWPIGNLLGNGDIVLPSLDGLVFFNTNQVKNNYLDEKKIFIERALLDNQNAVHFQDTLYLKNNKYNQLSLFLDFPFYGNVDNIYLQGRLQGNKWEDIAETRLYTVKKLSPGTHTLEFRFLASDGKLAYKKVTVLVGFLYYQTFFFKISVVLFFIVLASVLLKINSRILNLKNIRLQNSSAELETVREKLKHTNMLQEKLLEAISHDIATPIKHLSYLSRKLNETNNLSLHRKYYEGIHQSVELLYLFIEGLGNYARLFNNAEEEIISYKIYDVIEDKKNFFSDIARFNGTTIINETCKHVRIFTNKAILSTIIHNIMDNAVKNTFKGYIRIHTVLGEQSICIKVTDTGTGMPEETMDYYNHEFHKITLDEVQLKQKSGYGLKLVSVLIRTIGSQIIFRRNPCEGTEVEIILSQIENIKIK